MKKPVIFGAIVICSLALALSSADEEDVNKHLVGSYMFKFTGVEAAFGAGNYVPGLATLHSDGTLSSATGSDQAGPLSVFNVKNSGVYGVWFRTGHLSLEAHALYMNFSPTEGQVVGITKLRILADFDKGLNSGSGQFFNSVYACPTFTTCPDPMTATPTIPEPAHGLPMTFTRIQ